MKTAPLAAWLAFVLVFSGISYASRFTGGKPAKDILYRWATVGGNLFQYAVIALIVYGIAGLGNRRELFALRRPTSWGLATAIAGNYGADEFNTAITKLNDTKTTALNLCDAAYR